MGANVLLKDATFFWQSRRVIAGEPSEEEVFADPQCPCEELRGERPDDPQHCSLGEKTRLALSYQNSLRMSRIMSGIGR
jgi:hypothetical protein